jgi:alpha-L-fucosidase 2
VAVFTPLAEASSVACAVPVPLEEAVTLWYASLGTESSMMATSLPVGNGRISALPTGDSANEAYYVSEGAVGRAAPTRRSAPTASSP